MKNLIILFIATYSSLSYALGPSDLIPGVYNCNFEISEIEITEDREILYFLERETIATALRLDKVGLAKNQTLVKGYLTTPLLGFEEVLFDVVEQDSQEYGSTAEVIIFPENTIVLTTPTVDLRNQRALARQNTGTCTLTE